jgi:predicted metal-dependent phosphoesterase TrpH
VIPAPDLRTDFQRDVSALAGIADVHVHTIYSDGHDTPAEVCEQALGAGLDVIAITDHDTIEGARIAAEYACQLDGSLEVVVGEEVSTIQGHVLGLYLSRTVKAGLTAEATVAAIHAQGGVAVAAHPYWRVRPARAGARPHGIGDVVAEAPFDGIEVLNGGFTPSMARSNTRAAEINARLCLAAVGGSDAHVKEAIGWATTRFHGRSAAALKDALLRGRTAAARGPFNLVGLGRYLAWGLQRPLLRVVTRLGHTARQLQIAGDEVLIVAPEGGPDVFCGGPSAGGAGFPPAGVPRGSDRTAAARGPGPPGAVRA